MRLKRKETKIILMILAVALLLANGVFVMALRQFTVERLAVPLVGNVPGDAYFGNIAKFNDTWIALRDFQNAPFDRNPVLFVADSDDMTVWRATYNAGGRYL